MVCLLGDNITIHEYDVKKYQSCEFYFVALSFSPQTLLSQVKQDVFLLLFFLIFSHFLNLSLAWTASVHVYISFNLAKQNKSISLLSLFYFRSSGNHQCSCGIVSSINNTAITKNGRALCRLF